MMIKSALRHAMLDIRMDLNDIQIKRAQAVMIDKIKTSDVYQTAKVIGLYTPIKHEIDIMMLLNDKDKTFALPIVINHEIRYFQVDKNTVLKQNSMGILEPQDTKDITDELQLIYIPGLAFNDSGYRLGYGKGYFDKFLAKKDSVIKIGVGYVYSRIDFKQENHDIPMDDVYAG